jgi:hypothetical protein
LDLESRIDPVFSCPSVYQEHWLVTNPPESVKKMNDIEEENPVSIELKRARSEMAKMIFIAEESSIFLLELKYFSVSLVITSII